MTLVGSYTNGRRVDDTAAPHRPAGGDFVNSLQDAIRENPISAALIGMGVLWMFAGGSNTSFFGGGEGKSIFPSVGPGAQTAGGVARDTAARVGSSVGRAADAAGETMSFVSGGIREAAATIAEQSARTAGQAADSIASAYEATTSAKSRAVDTFSNAATSTTHAMQETGTKWGNAVQKNIGELFERQPLLLGAVGLAIGAGIAASMPTTEAENKVMGGASGLVREAVSEKTAMVKEMAEAGLQEAKAQGLTTEAAGHALRTIRDSVNAATNATTSVGPSAKDTSRADKKI